MLHTLFHPATQLVAAASFVIANAFGPPHIAVRQVTDPASAPAGVVMFVDGDHHSETDLLTITGRAEGTRNGQRVSRTLTLVKTSGGHYTLTKQWDAGTAWVLVLAAEQGPGGKHGVAEALVKVDATGKVISVDYPAAGWDGKDFIPRRTSAATIDAALTMMVAKR